MQSKKPDCALTPRLPFPARLRLAGSMILAAVRILTYFERVFTRVDL